MRSNRSWMALGMIGSGLALVLIFAPAAFAQSGNCVLQIQSGSVQCHGLCVSPPATCGTKWVAVAGGMNGVCVCPENPVPTCCTAAVYVPAATPNAPVPSGNGLCDATQNCPPTAPFCSGGYKPGDQSGTVQAICGSSPPPHMD